MDRRIPRQGPWYVVQAHVAPRNIRMDRDGNLWGEVPVTLIQNSPRPDGKTYAWSAEERAFLPARFVPEIPEDLPGDPLKPDPLKAKTVAEFVDTMRRYRRWAGNPSYREMADRVGVRSSSRFCEALKANKLPTFSLLNAFVVSLEGTSADFQRWAASWRALEGEVGGGPQQLSLPSGEENV
ncbi:hypothetical protein [Nocardiopsis sp. TNDT3]|uniref:hypothetical protein n=1 Tax=Nocardiopsis sp. TNDT3 TaxID=2249354 RepID=UPI000E3EBE43|nr:hypothetical protein [Nocardiopsis sp. TNDT3]